MVELGVWEDRIAVRLSLVRLLWLRGDHDRARSELAIGFRDANRFGAPESRAMANGTAAEIAWVEGENGSAESAAGRAWTTVQHATSPWTRGMVATWLPDALIGVTKK